MTSSPLTVRQFEPHSDLPRLVRLLSDVEAVDRDGEDPSEETQRGYLSLPGHDPIKDRWVIEDPDEPQRLIGFGSTWARTVWSENPERAESYVAVHPRWRRQGLGRAVLRHIIRRARELNTTHVVVHANERNRAARAFLRRQGFEPVGAYHLLRHQLNDRPEAPAWPAGYAVRSQAVVRHVPTVVKAMESYRDRWGHYGPRLGEPPVPWLSRIDPAGVFLAFAPNGDVAGICVAVLRAESGLPIAASEGHINGPGVLPEHRAHGLHRPLVLAAMHWHYARGCRIITLDAWGDDAQTINLYHDLGFKMVHRLVSYQYSLY